MDRRRLAVVALAAHLWLPARAIAQTVSRVAIAPVSGVNTSDPDATLTRVLTAHSDAVELSSGDDYALAAHREGVERGASDADVARVGRTLHVDFVLVGEWTHLARRGDALRVRAVRVRDATVVTTASWEVQRPSDLAALEPDIWAQLGPALRLERIVGSVPPTEAAAVQAPALAVACLQPAPVTPGVGWLAASVEFGAAMRYWRVPLLGDVAPRGYDNPGYAEFAAQLVALYPFARDRWGVGVSAAATLPIAIASTAPDASGATVALPTSSLEVRGGAALAHRPASGGSMLAQVEFFTHAFSVDTTALAPPQQLAAISYTGLRVALEGVVPLYATRAVEFGVLFGAELRLASVGSDARAAFGTMAGTTVGIGGVAGLSLRLDGVLAGLSARASAQLLRYRTSFAGTATLGTASDSEDDYVRVHFGLTYAFGTR